MHNSVRLYDEYKKRFNPLCALKRALWLFKSCAYICLHIQRVYSAEPSAHKIYLVRVANWMVVVMVLATHTLTKYILYIYGTFIYILYIYVWMCVCLRRCILPTRQPKVYIIKYFIPNDDGKTRVHTKFIYKYIHIYSM